jgi:hypothetical protein
MALLRAVGITVTVMILGVPGRIMGTCVTTVCVTVAVAGRLAPGVTFLSGLAPLAARTRVS